MALVNSFISDEESDLSNDFLSHGYIVRDVEDRACLDALRHEVVSVACSFLGISLPSDEEKALNFIHNQIPMEKLNELRMSVFSKLNSTTWFRPTYFSLAKRYIESLVGNELAMQNKINLSIQCPNDESSLLAVHADTWSEESSYQIVQWLPLVDVFDTKSMYILSPEKNRTVRSYVSELGGKGGSDLLFKRYQDDFKWLTIPYGKVLLFSPILLHGNVINNTNESRWSFNCRFKGLFTPYQSVEKKLGSFYLPISTKIMSRIGNNFKHPEGFDE